MRAAAASARTTIARNRCPACPACREVAATITAPNRSPAYRAPCAAAATTTAPNRAAFICRPAGRPGTSAAIRRPQPSQLQLRVKAGILSRSARKPSGRRLRDSPGCRNFGFLEHLGKTRFPVPKITFIGTPRWPAPGKTSPFRATGVPKTSEFAPDHESSKTHPSSEAWDRAALAPARARAFTQRRKVIAAPSLN